MRRKEKTLLQNMSTVQQMSIVGLMAAIICIMGPWSIPIPISPIPISLCTFSIYLSCYILGAKFAYISVGIYILIGLVGLPVFSGFASGLGKVSGPTGGYLIGYIFIAIIGGYFVDKFSNTKNPTKYLFCILGMILGTIVCYSLGTVWLAYQLSLSFQGALAAGVLPYIPLDLCKIVAAALLGQQIRKRLYPFRVNG